VRQRLDIPEGMKEVEALVAIRLYKTRTENIRESLKDLLPKHHIKSIYEVRAQLDEEIKRDLNEEVRKIRDAQKLKEYLK